MLYTTIDTTLNQNTHTHTHPKVAHNVQVPFIQNSKTGKIN